MKRLANKTAVVTGAGSGIGEAIALRFASEGARVAVFERDTDSGNGVVEKIREAGGLADFFEVDVASLESVREAVVAVGRIDILVNNAGIAAIGNVEVATPEEMDRIYSVNVKGLYHCLHTAIPGMREQGGGVVLNLASIASKLGIQDRFAYSMSKGAAFSMTLSVARDYVDKGIRCNCLCPARVHTPFVDNYLDKNYPDTKVEMFEKLAEYQPMGRMGKPEEIAALAAFLCSDEASFITGAAYDIDGGVVQLR
ncbi:MAG: SDR family oxidoreductase [Opitutaceae bacterium]|mgnify:FL=1|nr:SDR family oxidoreductase [Opitutaceae bacterium]